MAKQVKIAERMGIPLPETESVISRGDVRRNALVIPRAFHIPLYQANGVLGTCIGPFGLHLTSDDEKQYLGTAPRLDAAQTFFTHKDHFFRGKGGLDYLLPVLKLCWALPIQSPTDYEQVQSFYQGTVATRWQDVAGSVAMASWADPENLGSYFIQLNVTGAPRVIDIFPIRESMSHYNQKVVVPTETRLGKDWYVIQNQHPGRAVAFEVQSSGVFTEVGGGARLTLSPGDHFIAFRDASQGRVTAEKSRQATESFWARHWETSALIDFPEEAAQQVWVRSMAYVASTFSSRSHGFLAPPGALSGNMWPFPFPQDLSYIHPALLATGGLDVAKTWIERFHRDLPAMTAYTKRTYGKAGVHCPWVMPYGPAEDLFDPTPPNTMYYQIHNSGYLARMAHETAMASGDQGWSRTFAEPIIQACADFYTDMLRKGDRGRWAMDIHPAMGQDEMGGSNESQYLCALMSAQYTLQVAAERRLDPSGKIKEILQDGIDVGSLRDPDRGMYTASSRGAQCFGKQKHPPQLNPLAFLPLGPVADGETREAYKNREDITLDASKPFFYGWTLGEFLLASARMKDAEGFRRHWESFGPAGKWDDERVQIYETSVGIESAGRTREKHAHYFITEHGLVLQALLGTLFTEWWGGLELAPCFPWKNPVRFRNLRTLGGLMLSGAGQKGSCQVEATAMRNASVMFQGKTVALRQGEQLVLNCP